MCIMKNLNEGEEILEVRDLKNFVKVVQAGSFTKAAEQLFVSQPSLSKSIKRLEEELETDLLERTTRFISLTEEGKIVFEKSKKVISAIDEIQLHLNYLKHIHKGAIKIGISPLIGTLFFPTLARVFHQKYPNIQMELYERGTKMIEQFVFEETVNLGFVVLPTNEKVFDVQNFIVDELGLVIYREHPLAKKDIISIKELKGESFILFTEEFTLHDIVLETCKKAGFNTNVAFKSSQWNLIIKLVESQLGITLLPKIIFEKENNQNLKMIPLEEKIYWKIGIITKKDSYLSFAVSEFISFALDRKLFQ